MNAHTRHMKDADGEDILVALDHDGPGAEIVATYQRFIGRGAARVNTTFCDWCTDTAICSACYEKSQAGGRS